MASIVRSFASYYKLKTHSGLKKRIKIVGQSWDRQFKYYPTSKHHLNECKSANNLNRKTNPRTLETPGDIRKLKKLLPYWNFKNYY